MRETHTHTAEPLVEALTRREREVLGLLDQGLSAPEIAQRLTLAPSSAKWHIHQLYAKLGVNRCQQALIRARALGLLAGAAAGAPTGAARHNLPMALTRFFGREAEMAQIKELLAEYRLVTLTGAGGVGKTRLALRVAEAGLDGFQDGTWFVELAALADPALVAQSVAVTLGVRDDSGRPILEALIAYLRPRQLLLVLDNCEHLLAACARLADSLLRACPRLTLLATSREPLGSEGEAVFSAPSLPVPQATQPIAVEQLAGYPSVRLFADRARMVQPDFQITPASAAALARVCQRLDGVPLAIEMAAARMDLLTVDELAARLDDAFGLLTGGRRTALPRQQTLRAALDWSYDLLRADERLLLQRLSVFAGSGTLPAAEAVCSGEGLEAGRVMDALGALVAKSMVIVDRRQPDATRYRLLEMVRQYGAEKLEAAGDSTRLRRRHRDYFRPRGNVGESAPPDSKTRFKWQGNLAADLDNLRQALEWSFNDPTDIEAGPRFVWAIDNRWPSHQEYAAWCARAVAFCESQPGMPLGLQAILLGIASISMALNEPQTAVVWHQKSVALARRLGPDGKQTLMWNLYFLGSYFLEALREVEQALPPITEAEILFHELWPDPASQIPARPKWTLGFRAWLQAHIAKQQGQYPLAIAQANESIRQYDAIHDHAATLKPQICIGEAYLGLGELEQARAHFRAAVHLRDNPTSFTEKLERAYALRWMGMGEFRAGRLAQACDDCQDSLRLAAQVPDRNIIASGLGLAAHIEAAQGQAVRAATLSGASAALWRRQGRKPWDDASLDTLLPGWQSRPDQAALHEAYAAGQCMDAAQSVAYALGEPAV